MAAAALVTTVAWAAPLGPGPQAELAAGATGHMAAAGGQVTLTETVRLGEPRPDEEYELAVALHVVDDEGNDQGALTANGKAVEAKERVRPGKDGRTLSASLTFDARDLEGKSVVCFASLAKGGSTVARWQDPSDEAQVVRFPRLTAKFGGHEGGGEVLNEGTLRLKASLSYENLEPGEGYRVEAALADADTGETLRDESGKEIGTVRKMMPASPKGKETLSIEAEGASCAGRRIAVSATLATGGATLATSRGAKDGALTVPKITGKVESVAVETDPETDRDTFIITEAITYEGLVPGTVYVLGGAVRDCEGGSVLLGADGTKTEGTEATAELTPTEASGEAGLTYRIDASALAGRDVVTCDILTRKPDGRIVAEWDGVAEGDAVRLAAASSNAVGAHTGMACEPAWEQAGVTSVIAYRNLEPGREYVAEGELRLASRDGSDGGAVTDAAGNPVAARASFVPTEPEGTVELRYGLDATGLAGERLATREAVTLGGATVARVRGAQGVAVTEIGVSMTDPETGLDESMPREGARLAVKVAYGNVPEGDDVTVTCTLLDALTGRALRGAGGAEVRASEGVGPGAGEAVLLLSADTRNLAGHGVAASVEVKVGGTVVAASYGGAVVGVPSVSATLANAANGAHVASEAAVLAAGVSYEGLSATSAHAIRVALVDAETHEPIRGRDGKAAVGVSAIEAGRQSGTAEVLLPLDAEGLSGRTLATEVTVSRGETVVARGAAMEGAGRTVRIPKAGVEAASDAFGDAELPLGGNAKATVRLAYENLEPGLGYVATCTLAGKDAEGGDVSTCDVPFEASEPDGAIEVPVTLDTRELVGKSVGVRASVALDGDAVAQAETPDGEGLHVPGVSTSLHAAKDGAKVVDAKAGARLVDTVTYENLTPGVEYVAEGELADARTGKAAVATVAAENEEGAAGQDKPSPDPRGVTSEDAFEGQPDRTTVWVTEDGAYHLDKECGAVSGAPRSTTLGIARAAGKTACDGESGTRREAGGKVTTSFGPAPSPSAGTREEERPSKATVRFTPEEPSGAVDVEFDIDAEGLEGKRLVALETITRDGRTVAEHRDLADDAQSVDVSGAGSAVAGPTAEDMGQTGAGIVPLVALGIAGALLLAGMAAIWCHGERGGDGDGKR